jgi:hypothetical protein
LNEVASDRLLIVINALAAMRTRHVLSAGFDPTSGRFFSTSVYSAGSAPEFMTGILDEGEPLVTFSPLAISPNASRGQEVMQSSVLNMLDDNHFTWAALDHAWRAVFTRQK